VIKLSGNEYQVTTLEQLNEIRKELFARHKFDSLYGYNWSSYRKHQDEQVEKLQSVLPLPELKREVIRILLERTLYDEEINFVTHETDSPSESVVAELLKHKNDLTKNDIDRIFEVLYDQHSQTHKYHAKRILTSIIKDETDPNSLSALWQIIKDYVGTFGTGTTAGREVHFVTQFLLNHYLEDVFTPERIEQLKKISDYKEIAKEFSHPYVAKEVTQYKIPLSFFINPV
jgi:hypothetical protein